MQLRFGLVPDIRDKKNDPFVVATIGASELSVTLMLSADECKAVAAEFMSAASKAQSRVVEPGRS